jgi:ferritin-like metal-binding protein YciE
MQADRLTHLYVDQLRDLYNAETQLVTALPKMAKAANSNELRSGFEQHLEQTRGHVDRLERVFASLDESPKGKKCAGMKGLIDEGSELIKEDLPAEELDAGLIAAAQRVEHYEIAAYGCVRTYAELLGDDENAALLNQTLDEEKETDEKLTEMSKKINVEAMESEATSEEEPEEKPKRGRARAKSA